MVQWDVIVHADPEAWRWCALLSLRNSLLAVSVADALMIPGARRRMAAILLILAGQADMGRPAGTSPFEASQDELARMANLSRSSTGRLLQAFEAQGLIASGYRQIRVVDPAGLQRAKGLADDPVR